MRLRLPGLCVIGLMLASPAMAGPIGLEATSGGTSKPVSSTTGAILSLFGDEFSLTATLFGAAGFFSPGSAYAPGTTISIHAGWSGLDAPGSLTYRGQTIPFGTFNGPGLLVDFLSDPLVVPLFDQSPVVSVPFTLTGLIGPSPQAPDGFTLHGTGTMDMTFSSPVGVPRPVWFNGAAQFTIEPPIEQTPEPSVLISLGAALSGLIAYTRRRAG